MAPLIIPHDGAVHSDTVRRWKDFAPDVQVDWVRMAQSVIRYNVVIVGKFFNRGAGSPRRRGESIQKSLIMNPMDPPRECQQLKREATS